MPKANSTPATHVLLNTPIAIALALTAAGCTTTPEKPAQAQVTVVQKKPTKAPEKNIVDEGISVDEESADSLEGLLEATDMRAVESSRIGVLRYGDLWKRVRAGFKLDLSQDNARIRAQQSWFVTRQTYINRLSARASHYLYYTILEAERRGIPTELALLPVIESSYDPTATSNAAAAGMWQFIPSTGRIYGLRQTRNYDGRRDVIESTRAAYDFLTSLYNKFGSWELALASYNAGPGRVQGAIRYNQRRGRPTDFWSLRLPRETMNYVPRFLAVAKIVNNPGSYGIDLPSIANRPHFRSVPIQSDISLTQVSLATGVDLEHLKDLNPGFIRGQTHNDGPNRLLVPSTMSYALDEKVSALGGGGLWANEQSPSVQTLSNEEAARLLSSNLSGSKQNPLTTQEQLSAAMQLRVYDSRSANQFGQVGKPVARVPNQTASYIQPKDASKSAGLAGAGQDAIKAQQQERQAQLLAEMNALPTSAAQVTKNETVVQYPALTKQEREQIAAEIKRTNPKVGEVIDPQDGGIKLEAIQTQQSVLEAQGKERELYFKSKKSKPKPKGSRTTYIIKKGDTLLKIANRHGINWRDIVKWNQMQADARLIIGSPLYLYNAKKPKAQTADLAKSKSAKSKTAKSKTAKPAKSKVSKLKTKSKSKTKSPSRAKTTKAQAKSIKNKNAAAKKRRSSRSAKARTKTYRVRSGDNLIALARRFGLTTNALAKENNLKNKDALRIGQTLRVPIVYKSYKVRRGDSLIALAKKHNIATKELASVNGLSPKARLRAGQVIKVPTY